MVNEKYYALDRADQCFFLLLICLLFKKNHISVSAHSSQITVLGCDQTISNGAANTSFLLETH